MSIIDLCFEKYLEHHSLSTPRPLTPQARARLIKSGLITPVDPKTRVHESDFMNKHKMIQRMEARQKATA
jgi:hypothetical protein